jgi:hypothetical protein
MKIHMPFLGSAAELVTVTTVWAAAAFMSDSKECDTRLKSARADNVQQR